MTNNWWNGSTDQLAVCSRSALVELATVLPAMGRFVVARLDGTRMTDADSAFYEFSDALLFPAYFGWNWDALSDCLRDLNWLPADGYLIVVENAPRLLSSSAEDQHT
ncbi:barstar family protein, partial [Actinomycetes bacterium KLBMP 9797]